VVALMLSKNPGLTPSQVLSALQANARPLPGTCSGGCGAGIVNAAATVAAV
jgi:serine protease